MSLPTTTKVMLLTKVRVLIAVVILLGFVEVALVAVPGNVSNIKKAIVKKSDTAQQVVSDIPNPTYDPLTQDLVTKTSEYTKLSSKKQKLALPELKQISSQRKEFISSLMKTNPAVVSQLLLSEKQLKKMPKGLQPFMEKPINISGEFVRLHEEEFDPVTKEITSSEETYFIKQKNTLVPVYFSNEPYGLKTGDKIKGSGVKIGTDVLIPSLQHIKKVPGKVSLIKRTISVFGNLVRSGDVLAHSGESKKTAVILVNFQNAPEEPYTPEEAQAAVFTADNSVNAFYEENSFGHMSLVGHLDPERGDVFGWYTVPRNIDNCDDNAARWIGEIEAMAANDGFNNSNYQNIIIGLAESVQCGVRGYAEGAGGKRVYIVDHDFPKGTIAHELGHNFGLGHASFYICQDESRRFVVLNDSCQTSEYGDGFSTMGKSQGQKHFNNAEKQLLGWFHDNNVLDITESGVYRVAPVENVLNEVQMLRIPKERDDQGAVTGYYAFEYRQPFGFDNFAPNDPVVTGVTARIARERQNGGGWFVTYLLDATPGSDSYDEDAPFQVGDIFEEPSGRFTARILRVTPEFAEIDFQLFDVQPRLTVVKGRSEYSSDGLEDVTVVSDPAGINCGRICTAQFPSGTEVRLTALPNEYANIGIWRGVACDLLSEPECRVRMNSDRIQSFDFSRTYIRGRDAILPIIGSVPGREDVEHYHMGNIQTTPPGYTRLISAGRWASPTYISYRIGTSVNLDALRRNNGYIFQNWGGVCNGAGACTVEIRDDSVDRNINKVTAVYEEQPYLPVAVRGSGHGRVVSSPNGIDCQGWCGNFFRAGAAITLRATPDEGSRFVRWQGAAGCDQDTTCEVVMGVSDSDMVSAEFVLDQGFGDIGVSKIGEGLGTIISTPAGLDCGVDCRNGGGALSNRSATFPLHSVVSLRAMADDHSVFLGWGEHSDCTNGLESYECIISVENQYHGVEANFGQRFFCTDSDGGDNLTERGTVRTEDRRTGTVEEFQDTCHNNYIWEYTCSEDHRQWVDASQTCPESFVCSDGVCVPSNLQVDVTRNPGSPSSIRPGQHVLLASFDVTNPTDQEMIINEVTLQVYGDAAPRMNLGGVTLRLGNTSFPARVDNNTLIFGTPVSQHVAPHATETISFYSPSVDNAVVNSYLELNLVRINSSAHRVNGLPASTGHVTVVPERVAGIVDPIFYSSGAETGIEVTTDTLRFIVMNDGELQYPTFLYYAVEWLDAQGVVIARDERQGDTMLRPGRIEGLYFPIPVELHPVSARILLDSFNVAAESEAGEANNVRIVTL